jgi:hypothetical protein
VPGQLLTVPYTAVQFVTLQHCRQLARQYGLHESPRWRSAVPFVSGAMAGAAATMASYPFDLLRTTLAAQGEPPVYATMTDAGEWEALLMLCAEDESRQACASLPAGGCSSAPLPPSR